MPGYRVSAGRELASVGGLQEREHGAGGLGSDRGAARVGEADLEVRAGRDPDVPGPIELITWPAPTWVPIGSW